MLDFHIALIGSIISDVILMKKNFFLDSFVG